MEARTQGIIQRTMKILGSPFKFKADRQKKPDSEESGLRTDQRRSQIGASLEISPNSINIPLPTSTNILPNRQIADGITGSSPALDALDQTREQNVSTSIFDIQEDERVETQIYDGPAQVINVNNGSKECLAILLTKKMVSEYIQVKEAARILEAVERDYKSIKLDRNISLAIIQDNTNLIKTANSEEERERYDEKIKQQEAIFNKEIERKAEIKREIFVRRGNLEYSQDIFQGIFRRAFEEANLLDQPSKSKDIPIEDQESEIAIPGRASEEANLLRQPTAARGTMAEDRGSEVASHRSGVSIESENILPSPEELFRRMTFEEADRRIERLQLVESIFERKEIDYERNLAEYLAAVEEGDPVCSRTTFDLLAVETSRNITTAFVEAEAEADSACARARALGKSNNDYDQESGFVDDSDDGYLMSDIAFATANVDRGFIEAWVDQVVNAESLLWRDSGEPDDWDAESVDVSDSVSCVDYTRNRKRIDRWRKVCNM